jgi:hypothetical protein
MALVVRDTRGSSTNNADARMYMAAAFIFIVFAI